MQKSIVRIVVTVLVALPAVIFLFNGFNWLVAPEAAAEQLLMPVLRGAGLGSQISDIGGMFMALGITVFTALITRRFVLLLPVSITLGCIAVYRLLAFAIYTAPFAPATLVFEVVMCAWLAVASGRLSEKVFQDE